MNRLPFPKFLNRPRLVLMFEADQVMFILGSMIMIFLICIILSMEIFTISLVEIVSFFFLAFVWKNVIKENNKGYLYHFAYNLGIKKPNAVKGEDDIIPYGFESYFID
ncbi:MAG: Unknown protein [uncultured Campylobacterales bacterium]|uniref:Type IV conjugative transfer system protein TraL n=1 Tax=uncultured Campylobacterales bacterium TaxID=352960 RepID=A0A6S6SN17_9BACT|nr:MAG: Unknown protein [uncultured Campylobacterales bacterium]